jgi:hypothetical protein
MKIGTSRPPHHRLASLGSKPVQPGRARRGHRPPTLARRSSRRSRRRRRRRRAGRPTRGWGVAQGARLADAGDAKVVAAPRASARGERAGRDGDVAAPAAAGWLKNLNIGGGAILWYYGPVDVSGAKSNVDLFFANLLLDGKFGAFGLHLEPRFRDSRLRSFFRGRSGRRRLRSVRLSANTVLKVGKAYSHFGLFWDNSFYGNVQVYDGLKLDPDYGVSLEGAVRPDGRVGCATGGSTSSSTARPTSR